MKNVNLFLVAVSAICFAGCDATTENPGKNSARNTSDFAAATKEAQDIRSYPDQIESVRVDLKAAKNEVRATPDVARKHIDKSLNDLAKIKSGIKKDSSEAASALKRAAEHAKTAANKADKYDKIKPGWWDENINPFYDIRMSWAYAKRAAIKFAYWGIGLVVLGGLLQIAARFSGPIASIAAGILSWVGVIIGWALKISSSIFSHTVEAIWAVLDKKYGQH